MKIIPTSAGSRSRYMRPCARVASSAATSTRTAEPSGKSTRGEAAVGWVVGWAGGGGAAGWGFVHAAMAMSAAPRSAWASLFTLPLHLVLVLLAAVARDEVVL